MPTIVGTMPTPWPYRESCEGLAYLDEATTVNTNHTHALWASGIVRLRAGQVDRALEQLDRALRLSPRDLRSFIVFAAQAEAHHLRGDLGEALAAAKRAVRHNPNYLPGWRSLAAAAQLGQAIVARQAAEHLMVLNPAFTVGGFVRRYPYSAPEMWQSYFDGLRQTKVAISKSPRPYVGSKLMTRMIAAPLPVFTTSSGWSLTQVQTSPFLTVKASPTRWSIRISPSMHWQTMSFIMLLLL